MPKGPYDRSAGNGHRSRERREGRAKVEPGAQRGHGRATKRARVGHRDEKRNHSARWPYNARA